MDDVCEGDGMRGNCGLVVSVGLLLCFRKCLFLRPSAVAASNR